MARSWIAVRDDSVRSYGLHKDVPITGTTFVINVRTYAKIGAKSANRSAAENALDSLQLVRGQRQGALGDEIVLHQSATDQVFLYDALEHFRVAISIPCALWIDARDRPALADPQAVRFGPLDSALVDEAQLFEAALQVIPSAQRPLLTDALRLRLVTAQKDMSLRGLNAQLLDHPLLLGDLLLSGRFAHSC